MPGTFHQIYIHYIFAVKRRENLLQKPWRELVFKYISGIITAKGQKSIIVNGHLDHVHVFIGLNPSQNVSELIRDIKNNSSKFINERKFVNGKFNWQEGYGAFSYSHSQIENVYKYIANQEEHHRKKSFQEEYIEFLEKFDIKFDKKYLFDFFDLNENCEN